MRQARCTLHAALGTFVLGWGRALERGRSAAQRWKERSTVDVDVVGRRLGGLWAVLVRTAIAGQERLGWVGNSGPHAADWDSGNPIRQGLAAHSHWCWQLEQLQAGGRAIREQRALGCWSCACARVCCRQMTRVFARKCGSPQLADGRPALHQEFQESGPVAPASASVPCAPALSERRHIDYSLAIARQFIGTSRFFRLQRTSTPFTCSASRLQEPAIPCHAMPCPKHPRILHGGLLLTVICRLASSPQHSLPRAQ